LDGLILCVKEIDCKLWHNVKVYTKECLVFPYGYENITPFLAQYQHDLTVKEDLAAIRNTPDFILMKPDHTQICLVDVKYRKNIDSKGVYEIARSIAKRFPTAWLFLATLEAFYFDSCHKIISKNGQMRLLKGSSWIPDQVYEDYLALLREFETMPQNMGITSS